jgi:AcrR family transcriptional regulator
MNRADGQRHQEQRARILQAAAALLAAEGFHGMSMRSLAKTAGTSLSNVYNYFPSKEDILFALQKESFETLCAATSEALADVDDPAGRLFGFISHHVRYFADHPDVMRVLVHEASALPPPRRREVRGLKERYFTIARDIVRELIEKSRDQAAAAGRETADDAELERITYSIFGMLNWIYGWYRPELHGTHQELARTIHRLAFCGLAAAAADGDIRRTVT